MTRIAHSHHYNIPIRYAADKQAYAGSKHEHMGSKHGYVACKQRCLVSKQRYVVGVTDTIWGAGFRLGSLHSQPRTHVKEFFLPKTE